MTDLPHELRVLRGIVEDHRRQTKAQAEGLQEAIAELGASMRLEVARELVERVPSVRGEVEGWLAGYGLELET